MRARVFVTLKPSVFDPQGRTIAEALHQLGYGGVDDVRQGKYFELDLSTADEAEARSGHGASSVAGRSRPSSGSGGSIPPRRCSRAGWEPAERPAAGRPGSDPTYSSRRCCSGRSG